MAGQRPDMNIKIKAKDGGPTISLASLWTKDERPSGKFDRRIKRLKLELEDGAIVEVDNRSADTRDGCSHWVNIYPDDGGKGARGKAPASRRSPPGESAYGDQPDDDGSFGEPPF